MTNGHLSKQLIFVVLWSSLTFPSSSMANEKQEQKSQLVSWLESLFYGDSFVSIPKTVFHAAEFGVKADGKTVNTLALQAAIDAAGQNGGGVVVLPKGVVLSGALFMRSHVELRLDNGVTLRAVDKDAEYPDKWTRIAGIEIEWPAALINIYDVEHVRVCGQGKIDGGGEYWWNKFYEILEPYQEQNMRWAVDYDARRVRPMVVYESNNVHLYDFRVERSGFWTITVIYSEQVHVDGVTIRNNIGGHGPSTDGINVDSSVDVLVENCDVDCNDDNFCLKAGRDSDGLRVNRPVKNVVIRNCTTGKGHGLITLGSETSGGMENIEVYGLNAIGTSNGIRFKSAKVRGGIMHNIWFHDIEMDSVRHPFHWQLNWFPEYSYPPRPEHIPESEWPAHWKALLTQVDPPEKGIPEFYDIRISDIRVKNAEEAFHVNAYAEKPINDVEFERVIIHAQTGGMIRNAQNWTMNEVTLYSKDQVELENCTWVERPELMQRR